MAADCDGAFALFIKDHIILTFDGSRVENYLVRGSTDDGASYIRPPHGV